MGFSEHFEQLGLGQGGNCVSDTVTTWRRWPKSCRVVLVRDRMDGAGHWGWTGRGHVGVLGVWDQLLAFGVTVGSVR